MVYALHPSHTSTAAAPPPAPAARLVGATKVYGAGRTAVRALVDVTLSIPEGQLTAIMGPSGSGKSTLLHCLAGLDRLSAGQVFLGSVELGSLNDTALTLLRRRAVGFVFQSFNLLAALSARDNILLPLRLAGAHPDHAWFDQVVSTVGLADRLEHRPSELSGGQQQRVAVARALVTRPQAIVADEPTGNLDSRASAEILEFLARAARQLGQTVVMVTHDPVAASYADGAVFLADGEVVDRLEHPTPVAVLERLAGIERRP
ncbi:MAG: ABC transporter ATP-binding protein [Acidimicrobiales bacterium]